MDSIESRFVIEPSNILSGGLYVCTFQPGNFTGCGSEGVKPEECLHSDVHIACGRYKLADKTQNT